MLTGGVQLIMLHLAVPLDYRQARRQLLAPAHWTSMSAGSPQPGALTGQRSAVCLPTTSAVCPLPKPLLLLSSRCLLQLQYLSGPQASNGGDSPGSRECQLLQKAAHHLCPRLAPPGVLCCSCLLPARLRLTKLQVSSIAGGCIGPVCRRSKPSDAVVSAFHTVAVMQGRWMAGMVMLTW